MIIVSYNSDQNEGKGTRIDLCTVPNQAIANAILQSKEYAAQYGVQGTPGKPEYDARLEVKLPHYIHIDQFRDACTNRRAEQLLNAMSPEDINTLTEYFKR